MGGIVLTENQEANFLKVLKGLRIHKANLQLFIERIELDEDYAKKLQNEVVMFLVEVNEKVEKLRKINV